MSASIPIRRTQEQRRTEAEQALIDAAADLIAEGGSAAITLAKVGERAGYSRGLANHHFGNKAKLMERVVEAVSESFRGLAMFEPPASTVGGELRRLIHVYMGIMENPRPINRARLVLIAEAMTTNFEFREAILEEDRSFRAVLADLYQRGITSGEFPEDIDTEVLAVTTIALLRGAACQMLTDTKINPIHIYTEIENLLYLRLGVPATLSES